MIKDYMPYVSAMQLKPCHRRNLPDDGMIVMSGRSFTIVPRSMVRQRKIKLRLTNKNVEINGNVRHVWEKANWDMCAPIDELFLLTGIDCDIDDYAVGDILREMFEK